MTPHCPCWLGGRVTPPALSPIEITTRVNDLPLRLALERGSIGVVRLLVDHGADIYIGENGIGHHSMQPP